MDALINPEDAWTDVSTTDLDAETIERRLGDAALDADWEVLGGGLANATVRVGDRVLRIYRRDVGALTKEANLLERNWQNLMTPTVRERGDDFLVLEYVEHGALRGTPAHGAALGRALGEIHQTSFQDAGFLNDAAESVERPFDDPIDALIEHVASRAVAETLRDAVVDHLVAQRGRLADLCSRPVLLHGDFKVSNLHWTPSSLPLVLDWEFAWSGPALMDVGQLMRWEPPEAFCEAFGRAYRETGGTLSENWRRWAETLDLVNLVGLLDGAEDGSRRAADVTRRIRATLEK